MSDDDKMLDTTFAQMRAQDVTPSEGLMDRIMMDADSVLATGTVAQPRAKQSVGALILDVIGGWPSFGGLAAATVAGVWIGVAPPDALADVSAGFLGSTVEVPLFDTEIFAGLDG